MELVIPLKKTNDDNQELRYALRSWEKTGLVDSVVLVGHDPQWARGVRVLPFETEADRCPVGDVLDKMRAVLRSGMLRDVFIFSNDDIHMVSSMPSTPQHRRHTDGELEFGTARDAYTRQVQNDTLALLKFYGWKEDRIRDYELHVPVYIRRKDLGDILENIGRSHVFNFRTLYGNIITPDSLPMYDVKLPETLFEWSTPQRWCFSTSNAAYNSAGFREYAEGLPPSRWER